MGAHQTGGGICNVFVTGACRGFGRRVASELARTDGVRVCMSARSEEAGLLYRQQLIHDYGLHHDKVTFTPLDVRDKARIGDTGIFLRAQGGVQGLVCAASLCTRGQVVTTDLITDIVETNFWGYADVVDAFCDDTLVTPNGSLATVGRIVVVGDGQARLGLLSSRLQRHLSDPGLTVDGIKAMVRDYEHNACRDPHQLSAMGYAECPYLMSKIFVHRLVHAYAALPRQRQRVFSAVFPTEVDEASTAVRLALGTLGSTTSSGSMWENGVETDL
mmetsp:Transcript_32560/g.72900  ORF Transcript_32560/g.72900 Transcript_32560/m.72900 type:complete len:274 (-) Transcript_32560:477-1298(-)|eukprot:CAMPEP_0204317222 /NCGR_PEP_ID=MMETSP0469-20131031/5847_1 /ASSEMBLY_ACC=CAM_ASM_000384 /TAXON_ID=2969 /ORGANISM="Oxyrrhis marina" /LENGTH=273 /DNA_ID=CAMNT_0051298115 /DNA_START=19 /DNA_END=840 /DNA_ORIENTATION=-